MRVPAPVPVLERAALYGIDLEFRARRCGDGFDEQICFQHIECRLWSRYPYRVENL